MGRRERKEKDEIKTYTYIKSGGTESWIPAGPPSTITCTSYII